MDDEGGKPVEPAVGDPVDFTATGTVSRVDGGNAFISVESVNETPLPQDEMGAAPGAPMAMPEMDEPAMLAMASQADQNPEMYQ